MRDEWSEVKWMKSEVKLWCEYEWSKLYIFIMILWDETSKDLDY